MEAAKKNKRYKKKFIFMIVILLIVIIGLVCYFMFFNNGVFGVKRSYSGGTNYKPVKNPVEGLSDEQAVAKFDEGFVSYLLYSIGAGKLHNPPFSSKTPKIVFFIDDNIFNAEIISGGIIVKMGNMNNADIMIITSKEEGVKMLRDRNYVVKSFSDGKSSFSALADKLTLFSKGYLDIYNKLTGASAN